MPALVSNCSGRCHHYPPSQSLSTAPPPRVSKVSGNCPHPAPPAADPGRMEAGPRTSPPPVGGQVVLSGKLADQSRLLLRRGSQRSVGQLLLVMDVVQHEDRLSRKTRSLTLEPASLQGSLSTANRNHVQPDSQIARKGTFKSWLLFCIMTRPFPIESELNRVPCRGPRTLSSIYKGGSRKIIKSFYCFGKRSLGL